jgi:hypothetical protein
MKSSFSSFCLSYMMVVVVGTWSTAAVADDADKERGVAGKVTVAPEWSAAAEWPVDDDRAAAMHTPARVRVPVGRPLRPLLEPRPELLVVLEGEGVPKDVRPPPTVVVRGMRFEPGQFLLPRPGPVAMNNQHNTPVTIMLDESTVLGTIAPGETTQLDLPEGSHVLRIRELPSAVANANVRRFGRVLSVSPTGDIAKLDVREGEYVMAVYLGAKSLRADPAVVPQQGVLYFSYTVSANGVVDVSLPNQTGNRVAVDNVAPGARPSP